MVVVLGVQLRCFFGVCFRVFLPCVLSVHYPCGINIGDRGVFYTCAGCVTVSHPAVPLNVVFPSNLVFLSFDSTVELFVRVAKTHLNIQIHGKNNSGCLRLLHQCRQIPSGPYRTEPEDLQWKVWVEIVD